MKTPDRRTVMNSADEREQAIQEKMPKNNTISMLLDTEECEKIAKLAYENNIRTTTQAKELLRNGLWIDNFIVGVSKHLINKQEREQEQEEDLFGSTVITPPSISECQRFIANAIREAIKNDK